MIYAIYNITSDTSNHTEDKFFSSQDEMNSLIGKIVRLCDGVEVADNGNLFFGYEDFQTAGCYRGHTKHELQVIDWECE